MKLAQFQAYHIERYYWLRAITEYNAMYWAFYSDWSIQHSWASHSIHQP